jgi:transposase-like protein
MKPLGKEVKSPRRTTAVLHITTEVVESGRKTETRIEKTRSLKRYLLAKIQMWINSLLEADRDEFLGGGRYDPLDPEHDNYRNGYRARKLNLFGLGELGLKVPRDRNGEFESELLPVRKG